MRLHELCYDMRRQWEAIIRRPITWAEKQEACLALLVALVDRLAAGRVGQPNAPIRFFADMERLHGHLSVRPDGEVDQIATLHARPMVRSWLTANAFGNATKSIGGPVDVDRYLDYLQVRAIIVGEQPGWPPVDPIRANSEYVQAIVSRVIERCSDPT